MSTLFEMDEVLDTVIHGNALEVLKMLPDCSIDAICTDPPCGISFMSRNWDDDKGGRTQWVAWLSDIMREARRCLRPGGHCLVWSLPRTSHWTALALEDVGFEIRDNIYNLVSGDTILLNFLQSLSEEQQHAFMQVLDAQREPSGIIQIFGSGFPKSHNISVAIDRLLGKEREIIGSYDSRSRIDGHTRTSSGNSEGLFDRKTYGEIPLTKPATPEAQSYAGFGSALKPACENWWLVRKPLAASSIAENVLQYGTGAINIDQCRVGTEDYTGRPVGQSVNAYQWSKHENPIKGKIPGGNPQGRFPSHLILTHSPECIQVGTKRVRGTSPLGFTSNSTTENTYNGNYKQRSQVTHSDEDGMETVTNWQCVDSCPIRILDLQTAGTRTEKPSASGMGGLGDQYVGGQNWKPYRSTRYTDSGGASRYFAQFPALDDVPPYIYAGKASRRDRTADNTVVNTHPTVKSINLCKYLVRLLCPPNGIVLDCFCGSGSTLVAAIHEGFHFIGIEKEEEYVTIARARIEHALSTVGIVQPTPDIPIVASISAKPKKTRNIPHSSQLSLWDKEQAI